MHIRPITENCRRVYELGDTAVIGISPFNSYFSESRIAALATWALPRFRNVYYYLPDGPSVYTLEALGYEPAKAARKARRQSAWLRNKIKRALRNTGMTSVAAEERIVDSAWLDRDSAYQTLLRQMHCRFEHDIDFRQDCAACSGWVLQRRTENLAVCNKAVDCAVQYLLAELPLFTNANEILRCPSAVFCYHQCPEFIEGLFLGRHGRIASPHQGFVVVSQSSVSVASEYHPIERRTDHESEQFAFAS